MSVLRDIGPRAGTPQNEQADLRQTQNNAGGFGFTVSDWDRLARFLILGVDAGTYYVDPRPLALDNVGVIRRCLDADPKRTVDTIVEISDAGRAPKNDPAIFALAVATAHPDARAHALDSLGKVCRIGTHLFHFAQFAEAQRGWGRAMRRAVGRWYQGDLDKLAYQTVKYRQRDGWSHADLLRLAHPIAPTPEHHALYRFMLGRPEGELPRLAEGYLKMTQAKNTTEAAELVLEYRLPWEAVPTNLRGGDVWDCLLSTGSLPLGAMVRNLGVMTAKNVLTPLSRATADVTAKLSDMAAIRKARLHPITVLNALITYSKGQGIQGKLMWTPTSQVIDALDAAFYSSFQTVEPTGKRTLLGLDVSGSMSMASIPGAAFNARAGSTAMAMVTAAVEPNLVTMAFTGRFIPIDVSPRRRLDDQMHALSQLPFGRTDCSIPMLWALERQMPIDTFIIYTDNETWAGRMHPHEALRRYRDALGIDARLIVVGMTSTGFTIADPKDKGMLDVVGFDSAAPSVMSGFSAGNF